MAQRVLVAGVGNIFRRDDGFGSEVLRRLAQAGSPPDVVMVDYGIRSLHLAYDLLPGWDVLILVDAVPDQGDPGALRVVEVTEAEPGPGGLDPHGLDPGSVLAGLRSLGGRPPVRTLVVGCQVADVGEGIGLSAPVAAAVEPAMATVRALLTGLNVPAEPVPVAGS